MTVICTKNKINAAQKNAFSKIIPSYLINKTNITKQLKTVMMTMSVDRLSHYCCHFGYCCYYKYCSCYYGHFFLLLQLLLTLSLLQLLTLLLLLIPYLNIRAILFLMYFLFDTFWKLPPFFLVKRKLQMCVPVRRNNGTNIFESAFRTQRII